MASEKNNDPPRQTENRDHDPPETTNLDYPEMPIFLNIRIITISEPPAVNFVHTWLRRRRAAAYMYAFFYHTIATRTFRAYLYRRSRYLFNGSPNSRVKPLLIVLAAFHAWLAGIVFLHMITPRRRIFVTVGLSFF